jgi:anti-anti-sigma factor
MLDNAYTAIRKVGPSGFSVDGHADAGEIVLVFSGEADVTAAPLLAHALSRASSCGNTRVSVDLADLEFIDTHCLAIIFGAHDKLRERGADLVLRSPRPQVRRLLDILQRQDLIETTRAR